MKREQEIEDEIEWQMSRIPKNIEESIKIHNIISALQCVLEWM